MRGVVTGKRVVCVDGDGSFAMNAQELETIRRLHLNVKFFVIDNGGYDSIRKSQMNHFSRLSCDVTLPSTSALARAYSISSKVIYHSLGLREHIREVLDHEGPMVCTVIVSDCLMPKGATC